VKWLDHRLGLGATIGVVIFAIALGWGVSSLIKKDPKKDSVATATETPTPAPTPCTEASPPYGEAPDGFKYEEAPEAERKKTVTALRLDEKSGRVDMRLVRRTGLTLGSIVGVPSKDPANYAATMVATAQSGGATVSPGRGYALIPIGTTGQQVAVGVKGCKAVLISSQDPNATKYLADTVFAAS
jgi:hypothetical protein